jgi:hypothetical protein
VHHVRLPAEYRTFLLHAGNGGAGPYTGLLHLEAALLSADVDFVARPFPYQHWWNGMSPPDWWALPDAHERDDRSAPHQADYAADAHVQGTLRVARVLAPPEAVLRWSRWRRRHQACQTESL